MSTSSRARWGSLPQSSSLLAQIVDFATDAIISVDANQRIILFNRGAEEVFGWRASDILGQPLDCLLPADLANAHAGHVAAFAGAEATARPKSERATIRGRRVDGTEFPAEASISKAVVDGQLVFTAILRDVSQRRREEEANAQAEVRRQTAELEEHLAAIVTSSDDAIIGKTLDGTITSWNAGAERIYGYRSEELLGQPMSIIVPDDRRGEMSRLHNLVANGSRVEHHETVMARKDGSRVDVSLTISPILGRNGAIVGLSTIARDISERRRVEAELNHRALHDALTGLPNRSLLDDRLNKALARSAQTGGTVAVVFLDLDHFKVVNDSRGHAAGDAVLRSVAHRLTEAVRPTDTVARFGGDEFVVVCEDAGEWEASLLARRIAERLEAAFDVGGTAVVLSASSGIAVGRAGDTPEDLLRNADAALYEAKSVGRNRTVLFDSEIHARTERRLSIEAALRQAIARQEFRVVYQPIISLADGHMAGAEALLRWDSPDPAWGVPQVFIPIAESTGLIAEIGAWVFEDVERQLHDWAPLLGNLPDFYVSVNVSPQQLNADLFDALRGLLRDGADPRRLGIELTENVLMADAESSVEALLGLKALGVRMAIDDFGTGYSSLNYLRRLPVDTLKIDRAFTKGLGRDDHSSAIVGAMVAMARSLGLSLIAEGVETEQHASALRGFGCQLGQGFYWSRPVPATELLSAVAA